MLPAHDITPVPARRRHGDQAIAKALGGVVEQVRPCGTTEGQGSCVLATDPL
jgi:hypothetical protein